jgi:hypothetical protein
VRHDCSGVIHIRTKLKLYSTDTVYIYEYIYTTVRCTLYVKVYKGKVKDFMFEKLSVMMISGSLCADLCDVS